MAKARFKPDPKAYDAIAEMTRVRQEMFAVADRIASRVEELTPEGAQPKATKRAVEKVRTHAYPDRYVVSQHAPYGHILEWGSVTASPTAPFRRALESLRLRVKYD